MACIRLALFFIVLSRQASSQARNMSKQEVVVRDEWGWAVLRDHALNMIGDSTNGMR
jgi:hypothetical protein